MTLDDYKAELKWLIQDPSIESALDQIIQQERLSFAAEFDLPSLKMDQPFSGQVTTSSWLYELPESYQKNVFRARNSDPNGYWFSPIYRDIAAIDRFDFTHTETGQYVQHLAVADRHMAIHPKCDDTIYTFFYRKPDVTGSITEIPSEWISKVLTPRIVMRMWRAFPDLARESMTENQQSLDWWRRMSFEGLYGSHITGSVGFVNFLSKSHKPRTRGGRQSLP